MNTYKMDTHAIAKKVKQAFPEFKDNVVATTECVVIGYGNHDAFLDAMSLDSSGWLVYIKWNGDQYKEETIGSLDWTNRQTLTNSFIEEIRAHYDDIKKSLEKAVRLLDESNYIYLEELGIKKVYTFYELYSKQSKAHVQIEQPHYAHFKWTMYLRFKGVGSKDYRFNGDSVDDIMNQFVAEANKL